MVENQFQIIQTALFLTCVNRLSNKFDLGSTAIGKCKLGVNTFFLELLNESMRKIDENLPLTTNAKLYSLFFRH